MTGTEIEQPRYMSCVVFKDQVFFLLKVKFDMTSWALGIRHSYVLRGKPGLQCIIPLLLSKRRAIYLMV